MAAAGVVIGLMLGEATESLPPFPDRPGNRHAVCDGVLPVTIDTPPPTMPAKKRQSRQRTDSPPRFPDDPLGWLSWLEALAPGDPVRIRRPTRPPAWLAEPRS